MTINEKANEYIGYPSEIDEGVDVSLRRKAFKAGAEWMLEEILKYFDEHSCYTDDDIIEYFNGNEYDYY